MISIKTFNTFIVQLFIKHLLDAFGLNPSGLMVEEVDSRLVHSATSHFAPNPTTIESLGAVHDIQFAATPSGGDVSNTRIVGKVGASTSSEENVVNRFFPSGECIAARSDQNVCTVSEIFNGVEDTKVATPLVPVVGIRDVNLSVAYDGLVMIDQNCKFFYSLYLGKWNIKKKINYFIKGRLIVAN